MLIGSELAYLDVLDYLLDRRADAATLLVSGSVGPPAVAVNVLLGDVQLVSQEMADANLDGQPEAELPFLQVRNGSVERGGALLLVPGSFKAASLRDDVLNIVLKSGLVVDLVFDGGPQAGRFVGGSDAP